MDASNCSRDAGTTHRKRIWIILSRFKFGIQKDHHKVSCKIAGDVPAYNFFSSLSVITFNQFSSALISGIVQTAPP